MSNELADLGIDLGNDTTAVTSTETVTASEVGSVEAVVGTEATKAPREEVAIADLEFGFADFLPAQRRGGGSKDSKYDFDSLVAPVAKEDGSGYRYATFLVKPEDAENFDAERVKRSVQSAVTAANKSAKDDGLPNKYVTRQNIVAGVFVGVTVFRVDQTLATEEAAE